LFCSTHLLNFCLHFAKGMKAAKAPSNKKKLGKRAPQRSKAVVLKKPAKAVRGIGPSQLFASVDDLQDALSELGWGFLLLGKAWRTKGASLAQLLKSNHMMLHIEVVGPACELAGRARELQELAEDGEDWADTKLSKLITRMSSDAAKAHKGMQAAAARDSLVPLLAMSILCVLGDGSAWLEGKAGIDGKWVRRVLAKMREASDTILSCSDRALGLAPPMGRKGGYRTVLESLVGDFGTIATGISDHLS